VLPSVGGQGLGLAAAGYLGRHLFHLLGAKEYYRLPGEAGAVVDLGHLLQDHLPREGFLGTPPIVMVPWFWSKHALWVSPEASLA
jgi:hypothetical protein